ncbi:MAG TPA: FAD-binding protein, partial [Blastocatellia bacterium]|nr:FAD-binding protein [Blastocatellia bacterium]
MPPGSFCLLWLGLATLGSSGIGPANVDESTSCCTWELRVEEIYDAIVVGSGATGGWAAKELTEKGMRVIVLEAGRNLDPEKDFNEHTWPYEVKYRGTLSNREVFRGRQPIQSKCYACNEYGHHLFVDDIDNPYTTPDRKQFDWIRGRQVGGRTITWGRQTYRLSDYELKAASRDGFGEDWPIS